MREEFFNDMAKRVPSIALFGELFVLLRSRSLTLSHFGFEKIEDQIMLIFFILRNIMEKTLEKERCTLEDLAEAVLELNADLFHLPLDQENALKLAKVVTDSILSNSGEPLIFRAFDSDDFEKTISYLKSSWFSAEGTTKVSYEMSEDGFRLMLSTLEMEQNMRIRFQELIYEEEAKRGNYENALSSIREIFNLLKIREIDISEKAAQIRNDAASLGSKAYADLVRDNLQTMKQSRDNLEKYKKENAETIRDISSKLEASSLKGTDFENLQTLGRISRMLDRSVAAVTGILNALNTFSLDYNSELVLQLTASQSQRYSFRKTVFEPVLQDASILERIDELLHPLWKKQPDSIFQLDHAFEYKQLISRNEDDGIEEVDEDYDLEQEEKRKEEERRKKQALGDSLVMFLKKLSEMPDHSLSLTDFGQPEGFLPDSGHARILLSSWAMSEETDLEQLVRDSEELVIEDDLPYSFSLAMLENLESMPFLKGFQRLKTEKGEGKMVYGFSEDGMDIQISVDNLIFRLEGERENGQ